MTAHILGFPRIGPRRELKRALEAFWRNELDEATLWREASAIRADNWALQRSAGLEWVTVGDFSLYDHVLDALARVGGLPTRLVGCATRPGIADYFRCARGDQTQPAMELTKWFDTNYHYLVPEYTPDLRFNLQAETLLAEVDLALAAGHALKPVLLGPVSLLYLGRERGGLADRLSLLPSLLAVYAELLQVLAARGIEWLQLDEPILALDLEPRWREALQQSCAALAEASPLRLLLASYFGRVSDVAATAALPVAGFHIDLVRAPQQLDEWLLRLPAQRVLSCGVIDGRNVWRADLRTAWARLERARVVLGPKVWAASSCSLLHVPVDASLETALPEALGSWVAFARQKVEELAVLGRGLREGSEAIAVELAQSDQLLARRRSAGSSHDAGLRERLRQLPEAAFARRSAYAERALAQQARWRLPAFPTTTIGSFPQTDAIRQARAAWRRGELGEDGYIQAMRRAIDDAIDRQEDYGLDVLVHGEAERNDMVEYFGEQLDGFAVTANGWVQSYGSRCVKPPLIYGDVGRPFPMTVAWSRHAQSRTSRPVKGMLTGPVTILKWSFPRDDLAPRDVALQIALALRDEVADLEAAGIGMIQVDEPAFREGLPLLREDQPDYLDWAVRAFRLATSGVADSTQIHTHMCYSEFGGILAAIAALDADVITIETARSAMALLDEFARFEYPNAIGPGVYDIHSPRIPAEEAMVTLMRRACEVIPPQRLWVNPDCGLKTRRWEEVEPALRAMVAATRTLREAV